MSIVFSSEGLGLFNSTLAGGTGKQIGQSNESVFVNAATGNLVIQGQDESIAGLGQGLGMVRTYNSQGGFDGDNNDQWRLGFISNWQLSAGTLNATGSRIELVRADGFVQQFNYEAASNTYVSKQGRDAHDVLTVNGDGTALLKTDGNKGVQHHFNANKALSAITNQYGQGLTLSYTADKVTSITTKTETGTETTTLTYNAAGLLASVKTAADAATKTWVHYSYDGQNRLSQVRVDLTPDDNSIADNQVYTTAYTYHGTSNQVHTVSQSDGTAMTLTYDAQNRVKTLTDGESNVTEYFYDDANTTRVVIGGQTTTYRFDTNERLLSKEGVANHQIIKTEYGYYADDTMHPGKLAWMKDGLGNQVNYTYDARGNQLTQTDAEGRVITKTYNSANLLETETLGDSTTHYVYNSANQLRFVVDATGGVTEYRYNGLHQRTSQHIYTDSTFTGATKSIANLEAWQGNVDQGAQQRTDYTYDFRGQLQSRTAYSDTTHTGEGTGTVSRTTYVYDIHGKLLQQTQPNGGVSSLTYDGLGRVLSKTDANQAQTSFIYNDATQTISTRYANGLWETQTLDKTGALVSLAKGTSQGAGELGVERIYRDAQGRAVATEDAEGARSYVLYDAAGRKRFTVDALGAVTEFEYDKANQVITSTQFATLVNTGSWLNAAGELTVSGESFYATPNAEQDRQTLFVYNKAGQKAYEIDAQGYATRFEYNDKGQLSAKTQLSEQVTNQVIKRFNDPANSGDWYIYSNSSGKADFKAEHDASYGADVIISITSGLADGIRMDNLSKIGNRLSWDMNFAPSEKYQIYISVATQKGHRYLFYTPTNHYVSGSSEPFQRDAYLNFPLGESSRAGEWVHISRDLESDLKALEPDNALIDFNGFLIRGTGKIGAITNSNLSTEMLDSIIETDNDRKRTYHYDTAGNLEYQIDAEGYVTRHYYDAAGNQIATRQYKNKGAIGALVESTEDRVSHQFYNGQGQVIGSLDADGALTTYQYNDNGQKVVESVYLRQVQNHVVGNPLILPVGERVSSVWTYTDTGKIQSLAHSDGTYTYYTYDNMDNLVEKEVFEDRPPSIYNEQTIVDDNFNAGNVSDFTIKNDSLNSITTEGERVRFERLPASQPSWPTLAAKESYDLKDTFNIQFEVTTGASLSDTYFYGGLENLGSRGSTLDRHAIFFRGNEVHSIVARDGVEEPAKPLMHLTPNTTYVVRFESNGDSVTLIVKPKDKPEQAVSVTESSGNFTGKAHVNFYNNLYPSAENSVIYFDNYSVTKPAEAESSGISDNFDSGVMSQFTSQGDSINSISVVDGRVRFTRASASSSLWPSITSKERYTLNEPATIQFEVTTSDSLNDSYLNGGLDNLGTRSNNTLDRHAVQFDGGVIQSYVVRNGVEYGHKHMMNMTTNTTYVVRFETLKGKTVLTVMPKGQPEQAISVTESSEGFSKYAHILLFNNPRPGAQGTEIFLDNYTAESASIVSREKYRYDLLGRKVSTIDEAEQYNTPANPANWEIYDAIPSGPTISTVYDKVYGTDVIKLQGDSTHNGYKLKSEGLKNWNSKLSNIRWDIKNNEGFTVYISLQTELGHRFLRYAQGSFTPKQEGEYISHPLSGDTALGNWVTIERNLLADLKALEPDNDILTVNAFLTRGSSLVGDVSLVPQKQAHYDLAGNQSTFIDEAGNETRYFYDAKGQLRFEIDAERHVTEYQYNRFGQQTATLAFKSAISEADLTNAAHDLVGGVMSSAAQSYLSNLHTTQAAIKTQSDYDRRGLLVASSDEEGYLTKFVYNGFGELRAKSTEETRSETSKDLSQWHRYGDVSLDATITPVFDKDYGKEVIELSGAGRASGYRLNQWTLPHSTLAMTTLKWDINFSEDYTFYVSVNTPKGTRYITYQSDITTAVLDGAYVRLPLPNSQHQGQWRTIKRDILGDLQSLEPDNTIQKINALLVRGSGRIGDVSLVRETHTEFNYDKRGLRTSTSVSAGGLLQTRSSTYDAFGRVSSTTDANNHTTNMVYGASASSSRVGKVVTTSHNVDGVTRSIKTEYDLLGRELTVSDSLDGITRYAYDDSKNQITLTQVDGTQVVTTRNSLGKVASVAQLDAQGTQVSLTEYRYDNNGNLVQTTLNGQVQSSRTYTENNLLHSVTDANGNTVETHYDGIGRVTSTVTDPNGLNLTTTFAYQKRGTTVTKTETVGSQSRVTTTTLDNKGRTKHVQVAQGGVISSQTSYTYNRSGKKLSVVSGTGSHAITTHHEYDGLGRLIESVKGTERISYRYDNGGNVVEQRTAMGSNKAKVSLFVYNEAGERLFTLNSASGSANQYAVIEHVYDKAGREVATHRYTELTTLASTTASLNHATQRAKAKITSYTLYDDMNRVSHQIDAQGSITESKYDAQGHVTEIVRWGKQASAVDIVNVKSGTLSLSKVTLESSGTQDAKVRTIYNAKGQARYTVTLLDNGQGAVKENRYDLAGQLIETIAYANTIAYGSADLGATVTSSEQDRRSQLFYDEAGRLRFTLDGAGHITEQRYNAVSEVISTLSYGTSAKDISALSAAFNARTLTYTQLASQLNGTLVSDARVSHSVYNGAGQLTQITHADNTTESYTYYDNGLKATYTNQKGATWDYTYDNSGRLANEHGPVATHHYWHNGALVQVNQARFTKSFDYDGAGNVIKITEGIWKDNGWVANAEKTVSHFDYDLAGNQTKVTQAATTNAPQVVSSTTYDALGRATTSAFNGTLKTVREYDAAGRLVYEMDVTKSDGAARLGHVTHYLYDAFGQATSVIRYAGEGLYSFASNTINIDALKGNANNRQIDTSYDAAGRKQMVSQGAQKTTFTYNSFGEVVLSEQLADASTGLRLKSYTYFNALGQKVAEVDPQGYLTKYAYNAHGEISQRTEFAAAVSGTISTDSVPADTQGNSILGQNRQIAWHYDKLGRVTHKVHTGVNVAQETGNFNFETQDKLIEYSEYDALGKVSASITTASKLTNPETFTLAGNDKGTQFQYDALGRLITSTSAASNVYTGDEKAATHSALSTLDSALTRTRELTTYKYDAFGNVVELRAHATPTSDISVVTSYSAADKVTQHSYNSRGLLVLEKDANGNETEHHYNAKGLLEKSLERYFVAGTTDNYTISYEVNITDGYDFIKEKGEGLPAGFTFDATSGTLHRVAPVGEKETVYIKVTALNDVHIANVSNRVQEFTFRASDVDTKTTATVAHWQAAPKTGELYRTTEYGYDAQDNVTHKTLKSGGNEAALTWSYAYNAFGEVVKDNEGRYIYNALGQLHYTTQGDGVLKTHTYDLAGRLISTEHALNGTTTFKRDGLGRATYIEKPVYSGSIKPSVSQTFDRWGNIIELVDEEGGVTSAQYNFRNQVTLQRLAAASYTDEMGRVTANFRAETSYDYDALGNLVSTTDANTHTNAFSYDARGNQVGHKDGEGNVTKSYYDEHGRKVITQDAAARVTTISYDKLDQVTETGQYGVLESGFGYRFNNQFEYDELGNRAIERSAMGGTKRYRFDALGNVVYSQDEVGREMRYAYNSRSEQIKKQYSDFYTSGDAHQITQVIDEYGNVQSGNDLSGTQFTLTYGKSWDDQGTVQTIGENGTLTSSSTLGRVIRKTNEHGQDQRFSYYENGWLKSIVDVTTGAESHFKYDKKGRRTSEIRQSWDDLKRVMRQETITQYDDLGRIIQTQTYDYKNTANSADNPTWEKGQLIGAIAYEYDKVGNRRKMTVSNGIVSTGKPIVAKEIPDQSATEGQAFEFLSQDYFDLQAGDEPQVLQYSATGLPPGLSIDANTGVISGDVHYNAKAQHTVKITVVNVHDTGFSAQATMRINVTDIDPVTVANVPMILREEYYEVAPDAFKKYVAISDTSLNVRYSISGSSGIPDGLHFDSNTGLFSGQLTSEAAGDYPLTITLSDPSKGFEKQVDIHARIIDVPSVTVKADSGKKVFGPEQWFDGGYDSFGMEVPTGGAASWITLSKHNNMGLQTLTIEPPRDAHRQTPYVFVLFANDPHGNRIPDKYVKVQVRVSAPDPIVPQNRAPALNSTVSLTVNGKAKEPVRHVISATAFVDPDGDTITYSMSGLPSGLFFNASTREITGAVNIAGSYTAKLRATDSQGAWREANVTMNIAAVGNTNSKPKYNENRSLHLSLIAGQRGGVTIQPDTFIDPDGDTITYSMSGLPRGLSFNASTRRLEGMVTNAGDYSATLYATDSHNAQSSKTFYIYVDAASGGGGGIPMGATPVDTVSTATNTEHFNALDGASVQSMSSQAVSPTSTGVTRTEDYWFTYNGNNQVVIDGGSFIGDKISIADQGQYIGYNAGGQQQLTISNKGLSAQYFAYNSWGNVAQAHNFLNKNNTDLYAGRDTLTSANALWRKASEFAYDNENRVTEHKKYISDMRVHKVTVTEDGGIIRNGEVVKGVVGGAHEVRYPVDVYYGGNIESISKTEYNAAGEVIFTEEHTLLDSDLVNLIDDFVLSLDTSTLTSGSRQDQVSNPVYSSNIWGESALKVSARTQDYDYHSAGKVKSYNYSQLANLPEGETKLVHSFDAIYTGRMDYLQTSMSGKEAPNQSSRTKLAPSTTHSSYDANGNLTRVEEVPENGGRVSARYMRYDTEGKLLSRVSGTQSQKMTGTHLQTDKVYYNPQSGQRIDWQTTVAANLDYEEDKGVYDRPKGNYYLYSGQNYLGEVTKSGANSIKKQHFTTQSAQQASVMSSHQVQNGDTLKALAHAYYGDSGLWYIIADANGLTDNSDLKEGTIIDIPARANSYNSADNFKPLNLAQAIGDTTPALAYIPPPPEAGCNAVASIIMIAVAVVATIYTAGAASGFFGATTATASGGAAAAAGTAAAATGTTFAAGAAGTMAAGLSALGGGLGLAGAAAAAVGGFVGSVASQVVGKAMGAVDSFSLKSAFSSGITSGLTAGFGSYLQGASWANMGSSNTNALTGLKKLTTQGKIAMGVAGSISSVAAGKIAGTQTSFRWGNVAASALSSAASSKLGFDNPDTLAGGFTSGDIVADTFGGIANSALRYGSDKLFGNQASWNFKHVARDSFGNALGNSVVSWLSTEPRLSTADQAKLKKGAGALSRSVNEKVSGLLSGLGNKSNVSTQKTINENDVSLSRMLWAINGNQQIDANEQFAVDEARRVSRQQQVIDSANRLSTSLSSQASALESRHINQIEGIRASADAAFAKGVARGEYAYEQGDAARVAMPGRVNFDLDAALAGNKAMWGDGAISSKAFKSGLNDLYRSYVNYSKNDSFGARNFGAPTVPNHIVGITDSFVVGGAATIGGISSMGALTLPSTSGKEIGIITKSDVSRGVTQLTYVQNIPSERLKITAANGYLMDAVKRGGVIGSVLSPVSTTINAKINDLPILAVEGRESFVGLDKNFAINAGYDLGKNVPSALVGAAAGAAIGSVVPIFGTAIGFTVGFLTSIAVSESIEYGIKDYRPKN